MMSRLVGYQDGLDVEAVKVIFEICLKENTSKFEFEMEGTRSNATRLVSR